MIMPAVFGTKVCTKSWKRYVKFTTQNKLIRLVLDLESRAQISKEHFELLNRLPVNSRVDHLTLCHVF